MSGEFNRLPSDLSSEEWDILSVIADESELLLSQSSHRYVRISQECCETHDLNVCGDDNNEGENTDSDAGTLIDDGDGTEVISCADSNKNDSTSIPICKKKRKARGKRSQAAKRRRRMLNNMPIKPKMDMPSDLPALINSAVKTSVKEQISQLTKPILKDARSAVQTAVNNARRKAETKGRRTQTAAQQQKVVNKKWLKEKRQKADGKNVDRGNARVGVKFAAESSTELEESRSLLRKIATGVRKKEKSFQHASQKEAHRHRFRGEKKEDCLKKDKS